MGMAVTVEMPSVSFGESFDEVITAAKAGKGWAWISIYRAVAGPVTGFLRGRGAVEPLELAGDVFFELARSIARFEGDESSFRTFVFAIAHNKLAESMHSTTSRRSMLADDVLGKLRGDTVVDLEADELISENVRAAFAELNPEQRDVLSLRILGGLTVQETAAVIGRGVGQVRTIQRRALGKVRNVQSLAGAVS